MNGDPCDQSREPETTGMGARMHKGLRRLRGFAKDRAANVYIMFALVFPLLLILIGAGMDYSYAENSKRMLQDATDAAALAVTAAVVKNPNLDVTSLKAIAQNAINANFTANGGTAPTISDFHVCAPVQNDCTSTANGALLNNTVLIQTTGVAPCTLGSLLPYVCNAAGGQGSNLGAKTVTVIGFGATMELNIVMDTSASMIVGATDADVKKIADWMGYSTSKDVTTTTTTCDKHGKNCKTSTTTTTVVDYPNWNAMKPDDPGPAFSGDNPPCAFACHDVSGATSADVQTGLDNAVTAGATTRYKVMTDAATALINHVDAVTQDSTVLSKNTYEFNIWSLNTSLTQVGKSDIDFTGAKNAISAMKPGLDTYLDNAMTTLVSSVGQERQRHRGQAAEVPDPGHRRASVGPRIELEQPHVRRANQCGQLQDDEG